MNQNVRLIAWLVVIAVFPSLQPLSSMTFDSENGFFAKRGHIAKKIRDRKHGGGNGGNNGPTTFEVNCNDGETIQSVFDGVNPPQAGDTVEVSGVCNEQVLIQAEVERVVIDGQGQTQLNGNMRLLGARQMSVKGFEIHPPDGEFGVDVTRGASVNEFVNNTIDGGENGFIVAVNSNAEVVSSNTYRNQSGNGVLLLDGGVIGFLNGSTFENSRSGIAVLSNSTLFRASNNTISDCGDQGVLMLRNSNADIENVTIDNCPIGVDVIDSNLTLLGSEVRNAGTGIIISENSTARIGFRNSGDGVVGNLIEDNSEDGILVRRGSSALIAGNTIQNNAFNGVRIREGSTVTVSNNLINSNARNGISVDEGGNLRLDLSSVAGDQPNRTTVNNGDTGIICRDNSFISGPLGSLNGDIAQLTTDDECTNRTEL